MASSIERLGRLFAGYERYHGTYTIGARTASGKVDGKAATRRGMATLEDWEAHTNGVVGLGCIALRADLTVKWAALDIDDRTIDLPGLARRLAHDKFVVFRSKSGGAHVVAFFADPVPADLAVDFLRGWAAALGHAKCEIFPKQTTRISEDDIGNWLNMPYFDAEKTMRYALSTDGSSLELDDAVEFAESRLLSQDDMIRFLESRTQEKTTGNKNDLFYEGPPCLRALHAQGGLPEGTRNVGMFAVAVYLKKRYGDGWRQHIDEYNFTLCDPPLDDRELNATVGRSVERKDYAYPCKQAPIASYCDKKSCLLQRYGVGTGAQGEVGVEIDHLTKLEGTPVRWIVEIGGRRVFMSTEELDSPALFRRKCMDELTIMPVGASGARWQKYLAELMEKAEVIPPIADDIESEEGFMKIIVKSFLFSGSRANKRHELKMMLPLHEDDQIFVSPVAIMDHIKISIPQTKLLSSRDMSRSLAQFCHIEKKKLRVTKDEVLHVWSFRKSDFEDTPSDE